MKTKETKTIKLSDKQKEVIRLMREGWELGYSSGISGARSWLQKNGLGKGGETKDVKTVTFFKLCDIKIIVSLGWNFPSTKYTLTTLGKTINID